MTPHVVSLPPSDPDYHSWLEIQELEALGASTPLPVEDDFIDQPSLDPDQSVSSPPEQTEDQELVPELEDIVDDDGPVGPHTDLVDFPDSQTPYLPDLSELIIPESAVEEHLQPEYPTPTSNTTNPTNDRAPAPSLAQSTHSIEHKLSPESSELISTSEPLTVSPTSSESTLSSTLTTLYNSYLASIPKITSFPSLSPPPPTSSSSPEDETQAEIRMSKTQYQLTLDEGKLWKVLTSPAPAPQKPLDPAQRPPPETVVDGVIAEDVLDSVVETAPLAEPESQLQPIPASTMPTPDPSGTLVTLTEKSSLISESYKRRAHPATSETYAESKELLQAMGVPCVDVDGAFEAEALASALVLNGVADYVASEDTVSTQSRVHLYAIVVSSLIIHHRTFWYTAPP